MVKSEQNNEDSEHVLYTITKSNKKIIDCTILSSRELLKENELLKRAVKLLYNECKDNLRIRILNTFYEKYPEKISIDELAGEDVYIKVNILLDYEEQKLIIPDTREGKKVYTLSENTYNTLNQMYDVIKSKNKFFLENFIKIEESQKIMNK